MYSDIITIIATAVNALDATDADGDQLTQQARWKSLERQQIDVGGVLG